MILNYTIREIQAYSRGVDKTHRAEMAAMLWAAHAGASYSGYAFVGKRLPSIDKRLKQLMDGGPVKRSEVAGVIERMNLVAEMAGMPKPKSRRRIVKE